MILIKLIEIGTVSAIPIPVFNKKDTSKYKKAKTILT